MTIRKIPTLDSGNLIFDKFMPARLSAAQLTADRAAAVVVQNATFAPLAGGNTAVVLGDSNTSYNTAAGDEPTAYGYFTWANILLDSRLRLLANHGVGGDRTDQVLARVGTTIALKPTWVFEMSGTNDILQGVAYATIVANKQAIYRALAARGIRIVALPILPNNGASIDRTTLNMVNQWIRDYARSNNSVIFVDIGSPVTDPATNWKWGAGLASEDGVHFTGTSAALAGRALAAALDPLIPRSDILMTGMADGVNKITNPYLIGSGTTTPTDWFSADGGTGTLSYVPRTDGIPGSWLKVVVPDGNYYTLATNFNIGVGQEVYLVAEVEVDAIGAARYLGAGGGNRYQQIVQAYMKPFNVSTAIEARTSAAYDPVFHGPIPFPGKRGVLNTGGYTTPAGTTLIQAQILFAGGGTYRVGRVAARPGKP